MAEQNQPVERSDFEAIADNLLYVFRTIWGHKAFVLGLPLLFMCGWLVWLKVGAAQQKKPVVRYVRVSLPWTEFSSQLSAKESIAIVWGKNILTMESKAKGTITKLNDQLGGAKEREEWLEGTVKGSPLVMGGEGSPLVRGVILAVPDNPELGAKAADYWAGLCVTQAMARQKAELGRGRSEKTRYLKMILDEFKSVLKQIRTMPLGTRLAAADYSLNVDLDNNNQKSKSDDDDGKSNESTAFVDVDVQRQMLEKRWGAVKDLLSKRTERIVLAMAALRRGQRPQWPPVLGEMADRMKVFQSPELSRLEQIRKRKELTVERTRLERRLEQGRVDSQAKQKELEVLQGRAKATGITPADAKIVHTKVMMVQAFLEHSADEQSRLTGRLTTLKKTSREIETSQMTGTDRTEAVKAFQRDAMDVLRGELASMKALKVKLVKDESELAELQIRSKLMPEAGTMDEKVLDAVRLNVMRQVLLDQVTTFQVELSMDRFDLRHFLRYAKLDGLQVAGSPTPLQFRFSTGIFLAVVLFVFVLGAALLKDYARSANKAL